MLDNLKGELRIFINEVEQKKGKKAETRRFYNTCIAFDKDEDGDDKYINFYVPVTFSKALKEKVEDIDKDNFDILMKDGWLRTYRNKEGIACLGLFVNKATAVKSEKTKKAKLTPVDDDEDIPF